MAVASLNLTRNVNRVLSTALEHHAPQLIDNAFEFEPGIKAFLGSSLGDFGSSPGQAAGKVVKTGESILLRHNFGKGSAKQMAGGYDTHGTTPSDSKRFSKADWTHYSANVTVSDSEIYQTSGPEALGDLVGEEMERETHGLVDLMADDLWAVSVGANSFTSVDALVSASDTVQGVDGDSFQTWNARGLSARGTIASSISFTPSDTSFASAGISNLLTCWNNASEGSIQPTHCFTDYATHERYEGTITPQQRFTANGTGDSTFDALAFKQRPVFASPKITAGSFYMLHIGPRGLQFIVLRGADNVWKPFKEHTNQEVRTAELQWKGQLCVKDRRLSNKVEGFTD